MHKLRTPNEEETTAEKLFYKNFYVYVKNKAFYTAFELENIGFVSCGGPAENAAYLNEFRLVNVPLVKMAEWNYAGEVMKLYDLKMVTEMFNILDTHMQRWAQIAPFLNASQIPPIDDFEKLDALAALLYPLANIDTTLIEDPTLMMMFGNAIDFSFKLPESELKPPYEPYSPKIYIHTQQRWER